MLSMKYKDNRCEIWNIGEQWPSSAYDNNFVVELQASREELLLITSHFQNIPYLIGGKIISWYGETARFIAVNLHLNIDNMVSK